MAFKPIEGSEIQDLLIRLLEAISPIADKSVPEKKASLDGLEIGHWIFAPSTETIPFRHQVRHLTRSIQVLKEEIAELIEGEKTPVSQ